MPDLLCSQSHAIKNAVGIYIPMVATILNTVQSVILLYNKYRYNEELSVLYCGLSSIEMRKGSAHRKGAHRRGAQAGAQEAAGSELHGARTGSTQRGIHAVHSWCTCTGRG
jgi:hypothetical protein